MALDFNITEWARKQLKKTAKSLKAGLDSPVASERIASRQLIVTLADLQSLAHPQKPYEIEEAQPESEKILKMKDAG